MVRSLAAGTQAGPGGIRLTGRSLVRFSEPDTGESDYPAEAHPLQLHSLLFQSPIDS